MKLESARFIQKAKRILTNAEIMLKNDLYEDAGRAAYLAAYHTAQAYIFETTGDICKTHNGVQSEFAKLTKDDARVNKELRKFLNRSFDFKKVADYETGEESVVSAEDSTEAVEESKVFVAHFSNLLTSSSA